MQACHQTAMLTKFPIAIILFTVMCLLDAISLLMKPVNQWLSSSTSLSPSHQFVSSTGIEWHSSVQLNTDTHHSMDIQFLGGIGNTSQSPDDSFTPEEQHDSFTSALSFTSQPSISTDMVICTASIYNTVDTHILVDSFPVLVVLLFLAVIYHKCISFPAY